MKSTSISRLFEVGHFLYQLQSENQNIFFSHEIEQILDVVLENMEITNKKGKLRYVVNPDWYERIVTTFFQYCRNEIRKETLMDLVNKIVIPIRDHMVVKEELGVNEKRTLIDFLFELKYSIQLARAQGDPQEALLLAENKILNVILEELGKKPIPI